LSYLLRIVLFFLRSMVRLSSKHLRKPYDFVHVHSVPDFLVFAAWLPRITRAKVCLDIHDLLPEFYSSKFHSGTNSIAFKFLQVIELASTSFAHHVIAANHIWQKKLISRSVAAEKCSVFINYPDRSVFQQQGRTRADDKIIVLYPGTLSRHQGLDTAIRSFAKLRTEAPNAEFHIYGEGSAKDSLVQLTRELQLEDRVLFRDPIPIRQMARIMENADLGVVPKCNDTFGDEAFSTKILEFMAMGVPAIVSETTVDRYYFDDEVVTFFRSGDVDDLVAKIIALIRDPQARQRQVDNAQAFVKLNDWDLKKGKYLQLVDDLVGDGRAVGSIGRESETRL
jgi:glycosyltransferase involved in cell wall biosynthesis